MDMRNVAVGVVIEVIAATMAPQVMEDEQASPTLVHDDTAIVVTCPWTSVLGTGSVLDASNQLRAWTTDNGGHVFPVGDCTRPMSGDVGGPGEVAVAV